MFMKRYLLIAAAMIASVSCYDDYVTDYDVKGVGFANQVDVRSVVVGESMEFSTGIALGGIINNDRDREVSFGIDYSFDADAVLSAMKNHTFKYIQELSSGLAKVEALPVSEYDISTDSGTAGKALIKAGTHLGKITIRLEDSFLEEEHHMLPGCVIPLRVIDANGLSIIQGRETSVIGVRFEARFFGHWWHGGETQIKDASGNLVETVAYHTEIPQADTKVWTLTTVSPYSVTANAVGADLNGSSAQMKLTLNEDGSVSVSSVAGARYVVEQDGDCTWNKAELLQNRKIFLKYKYVKDGNTCHAQDTLTFRNRIRDGVNEWQDENPEHYN